MRNAMALLQWYQKTERRLEVEMVSHIHEWHEKIKIVEVAGIWVSRIARQEII